MPKKTIKDYKTKRRDIWKTKSANRNGEEKRVVNNVYIGQGNAKRWIILKKKLDYASDKDFVTYLLDLADPVGGLNELSTTPDEADKDDGPAFRRNAAIQEEAIESSSHSPSDLEDREWHPEGIDERLRRSPRKPSKSRPHVRRSGRKSQSEKKTKAHKKKKRKKVDKLAPEDQLEEDVEPVQLAIIEPPEAVEEGPPTLEAEPLDRSSDPSAVEETEMPTLEPGQPDPVEDEIPTAAAEAAAVEAVREPDEARSVLVMKEDVHIEVGERVKLKRRDKHRRSSSQEATDKHKHKKKKHRHGEHGAKRKHHDVRKAPHDGVSRSPSSLSPPPTASLNSPLPAAAPPSPPRPAKLKLCGNCDTRHAPSACPLLAPAAVVRDSVPFAEWEANRRVVAKPEDADDAADDDDNSNNLEIDEVGGEPTFAIASLPAGLALQVIDPTHGFSVLTSAKLEQYTQLGPLIGQAIKEMDIPDDFNMKDIWEATPPAASQRVYLSTVDPDRSNWLRYLRPAPSRDLRNLAPVVRGGQLVFFTLVAIAEGDELLYWADHTPTWSKKKMEKTNCGGCNLRFSHPLYYRLHCAVFHDPNFSLTIRKYHCKVCGAAVLGKENIMRHASEQHEGKGAYRCQFCNKFFLRLNYLEMHRTYGCAANPQRTRPLCDFCGRKFCQPQKLKVHIKRMHSDMAEVLREFQCKICLKLLGSRAALQRHMKEVHHKDIVGACTCDRCGKMFQNKSNLKIHMLTHSGVKPFKCREQSCNAAFTTKQCLQFHYRKVHSFSEHSMPVIQRSVAYTFDAYSGNKGGDKGRGASFEDDNEDSLLTLMDGDCSSSNLTAADVSSSNPETGCNNGSDELAPNISPPALPALFKSISPQPPPLDLYPTHSKLVAPPSDSPPPYVKTSPPYDKTTPPYAKSPTPDVGYVYKAVPRGVSPSMGAAPSLETYPREDTPAMEAYPREEAPSMQAYPREKTPSMETYPREEAASMQAYPREETPTMQAYPREETPTMDAYPREEAPSLDAYPRDETPSMQVYPREETPSMQEYPREETPTMDAYPREETPSMETYPRGQSPQIQGYPRGPSPPMKPYPRGASPTIASYPRSTSPSRDSYPRGPPSSLEAYPRDETPSMESYSRCTSPPMEAYPRGTSPSMESYPRGSSPAMETYPRGASPQREAYSRGASPQREGGYVRCHRTLEQQELEAYGYGKAKGAEPGYGNAYGASRGPSCGSSPRDADGYGYAKGSPPGRDDYGQGVYKKPAEPELEPYYGKVLSKGSKKWMGDHPASISPRSPPPPPPPPTTEAAAAVGKPAYDEKRDLYDFPDEKCAIEIVKLVETCEEDKRDKLRVKPLSSFRRPDSSTASLLVEAALDAAQRDIDTGPSVIMTQLDSPMDYMPEEMTSATARHRVSPATLAHMEGAGYRLVMPQEHYLRPGEPGAHLEGGGGGGYALHYDDEPASPSVASRGHTDYAAQELGSPSGGATHRYDLRQVEGLSSDEESLVAQNLTKDKALQLYEPEDQGLDMSRSAAAYHPFNAPLPPPRYHLYDDRFSPPAYPEVVRVVSLDLTPGRHTVDLSLPRASHHHPHHHLHPSRLLPSPPLPPSPQQQQPPPPQNLMSPPAHGTYPTYLPPSPRSAQPQGYHHYSGYY